MTACSKKKLSSCHTCCYKKKIKSGKRGGKHRCLSLGPRARNPIPKGKTKCTKSKSRSRSRSRKRSRRRRRVTRSGTCKFGKLKKAVNGRKCKLQHPWRSKVVTLMKKHKKKGMYGPEALSMAMKELSSKSGRKQEESLETNYTYY